MEPKKIVNKLLVVAYVFPPIPYGGTYRTLRLCKGLDNLGVKIHVLTINQYDDIPNDYDLLSQIPKSATVHRTPIIDPWRRYQSWKKRHNRMYGFRYINKIVSLILRLISIPDHMNLWVPFATLRGLKIIKDHSIDNIYVSSPPNSSQMIGYLLKKFTKVKYIADFRDPIVGNIAEVNLIRPSDFLSKIEKWIRIKFEKLIVNNADKVVINTETHRKELLNKFRINKFYPIRNSYDDADYKGVSEEKYQRFTIAHVGSMYALRRADVLFSAIRRLEKQMLPQTLSLQVLFVGLHDGGLEEAIAKFGIEKYVKIKPLLPHREAIRIMIKSHLLLLIKATGEGSYGQIPGKFFEYLGTKSRILCLGPKKSEVAEIIHRLSAGNVVEGDEEEMLDVLRTEYRNYLTGNVGSLTNLTIKDFNSKKMVHDLLLLL